MAILAAAAPLLKLPTLPHNGRIDESRPYFAQAYADLSKDVCLATNESARLERLKSLS